VDIQSLYYFAELAKTLHMTRTAERLYISQQTLSNHIKRLENDLGVTLLNRKPTLSLTCAGESVLSFANLVHKEYMNLKDILSEIDHQERGILRFGASPLRINACLPAILPEFSSQYPNVEIRVIDTVSESLEPKVLTGELDFAIVAHAEQTTNLIARHLLDDRIYLCVSDSLLHKYYGEQADDLKKRALDGALIKDFSRLPFCTLSNRLGELIEACFDEAGLVPKAYLSSTYSQIGSAICFQGLAACFATQMSLAIRASSIPPDINIFPLLYRGVQMHERLLLIRHRQRHLSRYAKRFLDLFLQYFANIERVQLARNVHQPIEN